jgi:hypothetical protein
MDQFHRVEQQGTGLGLTVASACNGEVVCAPNTVSHPTGHQLG